MPVWHVSHVEHLNTKLNEYTCTENLSQNLELLCFELFTTQKQSPHIIYHSVGNFHITTLHISQCVENLVYDLKYLIVS